MLPLREREPDILVVFENRRASKNYIKTGYRPNILVKDDYLACCEITFIDCCVLNYGEKTRAEIRFLAPEYYPKCLTVGQILLCQEAKTVHGYATITKICNKLLEK